MKHFFSFIFSLAFSFTAIAQTSVWSGSSEIWTNGDGSEQNPFLINSASNLAYLSQFVETENSNSFYFELTTNIDLDSIEWTPIGTPTNPFNGIIKGNNYKISNLKIHNANSDYVGLFGYANNTTISSLNLSNYDIIGGKYVGAICAYTENSIIIGCEVQGKQYSDVSDCHMGGVSGYAVLGQLIDNHSSGEIKTAGMQCEIGGIVGTSSGEIMLCTNNATIIGIEMYRSGGGSYVGGICGLINDNIISKCKNYGNINSSSERYYMACIGGVVGRAEPNSLISNCQNEGDIQSDKYNSGNTGGICGWSISAYIIGCLNSGNLEASFPNSYLGYSHSIGGICGDGSNAQGLVVIACYNIGNITCIGNQKNEVGGISGGSYSGNFYACYNIGEISGYYRAGIVGYQYNIGQIYNCLWLEEKSTYLEGRRKSAVGKSTSEELRLSSDTLNSTINNWNENNTNIKCNFYFKTIDSINDGYPILVSRAIPKTKNATDITNASAILNAEFDFGDESIISYGFKYKKLGETDFTDIQLSDNSFSTRIDCISSTDYYFKSYIVTEDSTYCGEELVFSTLIDIRSISLFGNLSFGDVIIENDSLRMFEIINDGNCELIISRIDYPNGFQGNWSGGIILQGEKQEVIVTFSPTETIEYGGEIVVNGNQTIGNNRISVLGKGITQEVGIGEVRNDISYHYNVNENLIFIKSPYLIKTISIYDISGVQVYLETAPLYECVINTEKFSKGAYLIILNSEKNKNTFKILKR